MADSTKENGTKNNHEKEEAADSSEDEFPDEEDSESDSDVDLGEEGNIQVDLEARTPLEKDFHGIKQLLGRLFLMMHVDASELTDIVIAQENLGSTIKVAGDEEDEPTDAEPQSNKSQDEEEDEEVYGISSLVNMKQHCEKSSIQQLHKAVLSKCKANAPDQVAQFQKIFDTKNVGFLINERFINIPPQFAVPLHRSLCKEVKEHNKVQKTTLDYLLLISKTLQHTEHPEKTDDSGASKAKRAKVSEVEYTNVEEELFHVASECSFSYSVTEATGLAIGGSWDVGSQLAKPLRTVMLVPANRWEGIVESVEELINGN